MTETIRHILLTIVISIVMTILTMLLIIDCVSTGIRQSIDYVTGRQSYWDLSNEWFQYTQEIDTWYRLWKGEDY